MSDWDLFCKTAALEYDPVRDVWTSRKLIPSRELEMQEFIDYKGNYPVEVRVPISGFKTFEASLDLQQKAARASQHQVEGTRTNSSIVAYRWDDIHDAIQQQVLQDLAACGFIKTGDIYVDRVYIQLSPGSTIVPPGRLQIIVPTALSQEPSLVSLGEEESSTTVEWNTHTVYILDQNIILSTLSTIEYISLLAVL
ncbi:hypothetical protein FOCG_13855 [Fusarium oxysporum f. sp. radicis-lycopersici 26381]|nr:hypothetical protein FOCG_13855 [Fusarium oxysporum f. sp. radicis-lycopersici 26381]